MICLRFSDGVICDLCDLWGPVCEPPVLTAGWCPSAVAGMSRASSSLAWAHRAGTAGNGQAVPAATWWVEPPHSVTVS